MKRDAIRRKLCRRSRGQHRYFPSYRCYSYTWECAPGQCSKPGECFIYTKNSTPPRRQNCPANSSAGESDSPSPAPWEFNPEPPLGSSQTFFSQIHCIFLIVLYCTDVGAEHIEIACQVQKRRDSTAESRSLSCSLVLGKLCIPEGISWWGGFCFRDNNGQEPKQGNGASHDPGNNQVG